MHEAIKKRLEEYLEGPPGRLSMAEMREHLNSCGPCAREVKEMKLQSGLLQTLRAAAAPEVDPGFYARVMGRIEERRGASILYAFLDPGFARRLIFASLAVAFCFGSYLVYAERTPVFGASNPVTMIASELPAEGQVGNNPERDRESVLLALTSYQE